MRSAIYYPDIEITNETTMRSALLLWDQMKVIVPDPELRPQYANKDWAAAWELIGDTMCPDLVQQTQAHKNIERMLAEPRPLEVLYRDDAPSAEVAEIWPQKLLPQTWDLLRREQFTSLPLANGDYPFTEQGSMAVMAKLADACAGEVFARWTDRFLAYGLVGDRDKTDDLHTCVVPITLDIVSLGDIPLRNLIDFREREKTQSCGRDFTEMRHRYVDALVDHVEKTKSVNSENQLAELRREFREDMQRHLENLSHGLGLQVTKLALTPIVVTTVVAVGAWLTMGHELSVLSGALVGAGLPKVIERVAEAFRSGLEFSERQRATMKENPMAYVYSLSRSQLYP